MNNEEKIPGDHDRFIGMVFLVGTVLVFCGALISRLLIDSKVISTGVAVFLVGAIPVIIVITAFAFKGSQWTDEFHSHENYPSLRKRFIWISSTACIAGAAIITLGFYLTNRP